ncbi:MAG: DNA topoisomerase III, partial [Flavobacteriaceae bacterium]
IKEGFNNLSASEEYDNLFYAGYSRAIGDWLLGMNATRLFTLKYGKNNQVLSIGRVQTPTLAMVVKRFTDIKNFKPVPYWELNTTYRDTSFRYEDGRFYTKEEGQIIADKISKEEIEIIDIEKKKGKEYAPKLFDLTGLQVYCNTKFGMTAEQTLSTAQKLYESKVITYPRVDTTFLSNDIYPKVPGILKNLSRYKDLCKPLLKNKIKKSSKVFNDKKVTDHHAIIPTGMEIHLTADQQKVYDAIVKRFIAAFYPDCEVAHTNVKAGIEGYIFKTSGKVIMVRGWKDVFNNTNQTGEKETASLPHFKKGEKGNHTPSFVEKETKPPNQFTEASLLRSMETAGKDIEDDEMRDLMKENGIGRPSTRASIIETLFRRKYIIRNKKQILPTQMGMDLIATIQNELLKSAELTGSWERKLKEIERGQYPPGSFIRQMKSMVDQLVYEVRSDTSPRSITMVADLPEYKQNRKKSKALTLVGAQCPKCEKGVMVKGSKAYGCSNYNSGCDFILPFRFKKKKISEKQYLRLLEKKETVQLKGFQESERKINGKLILNDQFQLEFQEKIDDQAKTKNTIRSCPKCGKGTIVRGKTAYGCSQYKEGCDFVFPFEKLRNLAKGQKLTEEMALKIMSST